MKVFGFARDMSDTAIRERVVHILSSTLNGCLREMGYFPGILQLLAELRVENANLTERNGKLHIDNVNLSHLVERQKGYIAQMRHVNGDLDVRFNAIHSAYRQL